MHIPSAPAKLTAPLEISPKPQCIRIKAVCTARAMLLPRAHRIPSLIMTKIITDVLQTAQRASAY